MIERVEDMPSGTIGLRAGGRLSKDEYVQVLELALQEAVESGELRLLFLLTDFEGLELSAYSEDMKTGLRAWIRDHSTWKRFALVTDSEWVAKALHMRIKSAWRRRSGRWSPNYAPGRRRKRRMRWECVSRPCHHWSGIT